MGNNPINRIDPSGHKYCDGENSENGCEGITKDDLIKEVSYSYGWKLAGDGWTKHKVDKLLDSAADFAAGIFRITGKDGTSWIRNHVGDAVLHTGFIADALENWGIARGMVPTNLDVLLPSDFDEYTLIHEMGHVFDNSIKNLFWPATYNGGGPSDAMVAAMGGHPENNIPRFFADKPWYQKNIAGSDPWPDPQAYGNHGVADDFAETFFYTLTGGSVPGMRQMWMTSFLNLLP